MLTSPSLPPSPLKQRIPSRQIRRPSHAAHLVQQAHPLGEHHRDGVGSGTAVERGDDALRGLEGGRDIDRADGGVPAGGDQRARQRHLSRADRDGDDGADVRGGAGEGLRGQDRAAEPGAARRARRRGRPRGAVPGQRGGQLRQWAGVGCRWGVERWASVRAGEDGLRGGGGDEGEEEQGKRGQDYLYVCILSIGYIYIYSNNTYIPTYTM